MSASSEVTISAEESASAVDAILARSGFPVSEAARERLIRFYPLVRGWMERLRAIEARNADPVLVYSAAPRD